MKKREDDGTGGRVGFVNFNFNQTFGTAILGLRDEIGGM